MEDRTLQIVELFPRMPVFDEPIERVMELFIRENVDVGHTAKIILNRRFGRQKIFTGRIDSLPGKLNLVTKTARYIIAYGAIEDVKHSRTTARKKNGRG